MAENNEEVVILKEPGEEAPEEIVSIENIQEKLPETPQPSQEPKPSGKQNKKLIIILAALGGLAVILIAVLLVLALKKESPRPVAQNADDLIKTIENSYKTKTFGASKIDDMIAKANQLYEKGNKFEALKIYENVAVYNQSLSNYNLGVSQMKQGKCDEAIASFNKAVQNGENAAVSAINAAACSLELKNVQNFEYFIGLANSFLPDEANSPLYSYYYALVNYYKGNYYEALHALEHPSSDDYRDRYDYLSAKILSLLNQDEKAIEKLKAQKSYKPDFTVAQLYANAAQYDKAREHLQKALKKADDPDLIKMTLAIINLKTGFYGEAASAIREIYTKDPLKPSKFYKIKATLNPELFDINLAQARFNDDMFFDKTRRYETLFYFAPYKVFDAKQTIEYIRKGGVSVFVDDTTSANEYLSKGAAISKINIELSSAIAKALNYKLKEANADFARLAKSYPQHSILQYNLALSYAQLGNFSLAAKHFTSSYHLDQNNHLAGIFAAISMDITRSLDPKLISQISKNLESDKNTDKAQLYTALLNLINNNQSALIRYLEEPKDENMLNLSLDAIIAKIVGQEAAMKQKTARMTQILPKDVIANILNFIANNRSRDIKEYAKQAQIYFKDKDLDMGAFYHGASIIRKQYIKLLQISGLLGYERDKIRAQLNASPKDVNIMQTLAYVELFLADFQSAYALYNKIIDEYKIDDANTLFLASVAATGANKAQNAIALLELTKLTDPNALENRAALGILYQQLDNIEAALIQYDKIGEAEFKNEFYDFEIDYGR